jgi:hypothetical protein
MLIRWQRSRRGRSRYGAHLTASGRVGLVLFVTAACGSATQAAQVGWGGDGSSPEIAAVVIHPPVAAEFVCSEHPFGAEGHAGDALASDCYVVRRDAGPSGTFPRFYVGDGTRNEDWFSWNEPLLAPFDGVVRLIHVNAVTNEPGVRGQGPSSFVLFQRLREPGDVPVQVGYVHVQEIRVEVGDTVYAGEVVARIGNNGISDAPHVHVGAMLGDLAKAMSGETQPDDVVPLQVRFDLKAMGRLRGYLR